METDYVLNPNDGGPVRTDVAGRLGQRAFSVLEQWTAAQAAAKSTTALHAAVADTGLAQVITSGFTQPSVARTVTITATGTAGDVAALQHTIKGTNLNDEAQTELMPAFTLNTLGTVESTKAFKTITEHDQPAHDGTGVSFSVGTGDGLGLPYMMPRNGVLAAYLGTPPVREGTAPTVTFSATVLGLNLMRLSSALNGTAVAALLLL